MPKNWDHLMKALAKINPQSLVSFVLPGVTYVSEVSNNLQVHSRSIEPDVLYNILWAGQEAILHLEFQRRRDENMGKRAWEYNMITTFLSQRPVFTCVIYLKKDGNIVESPYQQKMPDGEVSHLFFFKNIKLWELPRQVFREQGLEGLLPLSPLTENGAQRVAIEEMIANLQAVHREDLLPLAYAFAALVFERQSDRQWLKRRFDMLQDILEKSWAYQEMFQDATEKGLQKGFQQGIEQGAQQTLTHYIEMRFPALASLLEKNISDIHDAEMLQRLLFDLFTAQNEQQAESMILHIHGQAE